MKSHGLQVFSLIVFAAAIAVIIGTTLHYSGRIPNTKIPMQWGVDGTPNWYAPRVIGLWFSLYLAVAVGLGLIVLAYVAERGDGVWYGVMLFAITLAVIHVWHLGAVARWASSE